MTSGRAARIPTSSAGGDRTYWRTATYVFELKLDGVRIVAECRDEATSLTYRSGRSADDFLQIGAHDLRGIALEHRKAMLQQLLAERSGGLVQYVDRWPQGTKLFELCVAKELEGIVAKRRASTYREGPNCQPSKRYR